MRSSQPVDSLSGSEDKKHVGDDDRQPLEEDRGRAGVVQVLHQQHVSVKVLSHVGQAQLEPGEQRRVVQSPRRRVLQHNTQQSGTSNQPWPQNVYTTHCQTGTAGLTRITHDQLKTHCSTFKG